MAMDMQPKVGDYSINLPITFDYKGGRGENKKGKIIFSIVIVVLTGIGVAGTATNSNFELWQKVAIPLCVFYVGLFLMRFFVFRELWFSDIYEELKATDFELKLDDVWQIFDIDFNYPYTCYFKNGYKGVFVRMEKDVITGKPEKNMFDHYEAVGDAYNLAHSLNMNIVHVDYMGNVGDDSRMDKLFNDLAFVENPDMQDMLVDIYTNLKEEMSYNYASYDVYCFMTRDKLTSFVYNIQSVCNRMLGGNYITYKALDRYEIARVCTSLFNLHDFSVVEACENVLQNEEHHGIIPIQLIHSDGSVTEFNKTREEKERIAKENARKQAEKQAEVAKEKRKRKEARKIEKSGGVVPEPPKPFEDDDEDLHLFD